MRKEKRLIFQPEDEGSVGALIRELGGQQEPKALFADGKRILFHGEHDPSVQREFDCLMLDPPFELWPTLKLAGTYKTVVAFTTVKFRHHVERILGPPRCELIWAFHGNGRWLSHYMPRLIHESILVWGHTGVSYVGEPNTRKPGSRGKGKWKGDHSYTPRERCMIPSILEFDRDRDNPAGGFGKPVALFETLFRWLGCQSVFDPFAGGSTTLLAAQRLDIVGVGMEKNRDTATRSVRRLKTYERVQSFEASGVGA